MKYRSYAIIKNDNGTEIDEAFTDIIDRGGYLIIDKEELAKSIIDENEEKLQQDDCDISMLVYNDISEIVSDISEIIDELINNNG